MRHSSRTKPIILIGSILILIVCSTVWFFNNFEYKEVEKSTGYSKEARKNDFLAAEYYLKELGMNVTSNGNRAKLLETHDPNKTIVLNNYGPKLSPTHFNKLKEWINNGGHLIMEANEPSFSFFNIEIDKEKIKHNQLLEEFNVYANFIDYSDTEVEEEPEYEVGSSSDIEMTSGSISESDTENNTETDCECDEDIEVTNYTLMDGTQLSIDFSIAYYLFDPNNHASFKLEDEYGIRLLQIEMGKGLLTVVSDNSIFKNYAIENNDHAFLLSRLVNMNASNADGEILLLFSTESDSIFTLLWRNAKQLCIAFFCMLFIALWSMYNRLGPIIPHISYNNRNIIEHLSAIARYSWRQDRGKYLLHKSRIACEQFFVTRYPILKNMSTQERVDHLSEVLDTTPSVILTALYTEPNSTHEYINSSYQLQKLWIQK